MTSNTITQNTRDHDPLSLRPPTFVAFKINKPIMHPVTTSNNNTVLIINTVLEKDRMFLKKAQIRHFGYLTRWRPVHTAGGDALLALHEGRPVS